MPSASEYDQSFFGGSSYPSIGTGGGPAIQTTDEELQRFEYLRTRVYAQYIVEQRLDDYYYKSKFGVDLIPKEWQDKGFKPTIPPTAYNSVEAASDQILSTPEIYVPELPTDGEHVQAQSVADNKKQALDYFWHNVFLMGDPLGHGKKKLVKDGRIVIKKLLDWDKINPNGLHFGQKGFLWKLRLLANDTVYEDPDNPEDPQYVYESIYVPCHIAKRYFPDARKALAGKSRDDMVRVTECWTKPGGTDKGYRIMWVNDERIFRKDNPYHWVVGFSATGKETYDGYIPYFIADSGWGDLDAARAPHERYVGILRYIRSVIETEARQVTAADAQIRVSTFPFSIFRGIAEDQQVVIKPGARINLTGTKDEQDIEFKTWPSVPEGIWQLIASVHQAANESARFGTFSGSPQRGVDSATEADATSRSASAKLMGPVNGLRSLIMRVNRTTLQDVEHLIEGAVTLYGAAQEGSGSVTLSPEDINGFYETFVELKTSDQMALEGAKMRRWMDAYQVFGLDREFSMRSAGIPQPRQRITRRLDEDVLFDPRLHEVRVANAMQGMGPAGELVAQSIMTGMAAGGVPPEEQSGGSFPGIAQEQGVPQQPAGQDIRASAFGRALELRPDAAYR